MARARRPELYADAAYAMITKPSRHCTGKAFLCEDVLPGEGVTDFDRYADQSGAEPQATSSLTTPNKVRLGEQAYVKAPMPVMARPTMSVCMVSVPSKVWIASRSTMCRMTW